MRHLWDGKSIDALVTIIDKLNYFVDRNSKEVDERLDTIDERLGAVDTRQDTLEERVLKLEQKVYENELMDRARDKIHYRTREELTCLGFKVEKLFDSLANLSKSVAELSKNYAEYQQRTDTLAMATAVHAIYINEELKKESKN